MRVHCAASVIVCADGVLTPYVPLCWQIKEMNTESVPEGKRSIPYPRDDLKIAIPCGQFRTFPGCPGRPSGGRFHGMPGEAAFPGLSPSSAALACSLLMAVGGR
jgi:hypothetical protein